MSSRLTYLASFALTTGAALRLISLWREIGRARELASQGAPYERRVPPGGPRVLVLGDSTGVGIGASCPEESVAGLLATEFPDADIVNVSRSGARVVNALAQARECSQRALHFDVALLHVGGNDVLRATPRQKLSEDCRLLMTELSVLADQTVWLGPLDIGIVPLFPPPFSWVFRARSRAAATAFAECAATHRVAFIDFSRGDHATRFANDRHQHFAADGLHPSSSTYSYGYAVIRRAIAMFDGDTTNVDPLCRLN